MSSILRSCTAFGLSVLILLGQPFPTFAETTVTSNPDTKQLQPVIQFDPNNPPQDSEEIPEAENKEENSIYQLDTTSPLSVSGEEIPDLSKKLEEAEKSLREDIPAAQTKMTNVVTSFQNLVRQVEAEFPEGSPYRSILTSIAGNTADVRLILESRLSEIKNESNPPENGFSILGEPDEVLLDRAERIISLKNEYKTQSDYYESEYVFLKNRYDGFKEALAKIDNAMTGIKAEKLKLSVSLEAKKVSFGSLALSVSEFVAAIAKDLQTQIGVTLNDMEKAITVLGELRTKLLQSRVAQEGAYILPQVETIRQQFAAGGIYKISEAYYASELVFYQNLNLQLIPIISQSTISSRAADYNSTAFQKEMAGLQTKFKSLTTSSSVFIAETAQKLIDEIGTILNTEKGNAVLKNTLVAKIRASRTPAEAQFHLEELKKLSAQYSAGGLSQSLKHYKSEYTFYSQLNTQLRTLVQKAAALVSQADSRNKSYLKQLEALTVNLTGILEKTPEYAEISDLLKSIAQTGTEGAEDIRFLMKALEQIKQARTFDEAQKIAALIDERSAKFQYTTGLYSARVNFFNQEYSRYRSLSNSLKSIKMYYNSAMEKLRDSESDLQAFFEGWEKDTTLTAVMRQAMQPTIDKMKILLVDVKTMIAQVQLDYEAAVSQRDVVKINFQLRKMSQNSTDASRLVARQSTLRSELLRVVAKLKLKYQTIAFLNGFLS